MSKTALTEKMAASGVRIGEYCGVETALTFGDSRAEFDALLHGCGVYDLGWRSRIIVTGKDRVRWLNGMITNNIRDLQPGRGNYSFVLTPQGHVQGDLYAYNRNEYILLETEQSQTAVILERLKKYIIMDKVELEDISDRLTAIGVQGPKAGEILKAVGFDAPDVGPMEVADFVWQGLGLSVTRMSDDNFLAYELWLASENVATVWNALTEAGGLPVGIEALEMFRVAAGIPRFGTDIRDRVLPQETGQQQALNFTKGCYIGQEIVERIRARGNVHRSLTGIVVEGGVPEKGTKLLLDGKEVGEITSAVAVPSDDGERVLALAILRREAAKLETSLQAGESKAKVEPLPFREVRT